MLNQLSSMKSLLTLDVCLDSMKCKLKSTRTSVFRDPRKISDIPTKFDYFTLIYIHKVFKIVIKVILMEYNLRYM